MRICMCVHALAIQRPMRFHAALLATSDAKGRA